MKLILWSRDRACQLETLISSLITHQIDWGTDIHVIFSCSNERFMEGYRLLQKMAPSINFHLKNEKDVKTQILDIVGKDNFGFSADDNIIFRTPPNKNFDSLVENVTCFSLRLGFNTVVQNCFATPILYQPPLSVYNDEGDTISWDSSFYHPLYNYGYTFAFDLHLFNSKIVLPLLKKCHFSRPNELETEMVTKGKSLPRVMRSFKESCAVNVPINNMSTITSSLNGSLEEINKMFLNGKRLSYNIERIVGCHQTLQEVWN